MQHDKLVRAVRAPLAAALLAAAALTSACGGGNGDSLAGAPGVLLQVDTLVGGTPAGEPALAGREVSEAIQPGQSVTFVANEPVAWKATVNGVDLASGTSITVGGVSITESTESALQAAIATSLVGPPALPIAVTLTAVSLRDVTQVATVQLQVR